MKTASRFKFSSLTLLCLIFSIPAFAQGSDYFISKKNDTIKYVLKEPFPNILKNSLRYSLPNSADFKKLSLDTVKEYSIDNHIYSRQSLTSDTLKSTFLMRKLHGRIDLFELLIVSPSGMTPNGIITVGTNNVSYYAAKAGYPLLEIKTNTVFFNNKKHLQMLYDLLADAPGLLEKFKAADNYSFRDINNILLEYNEFFGPVKNYIITQKNDTVRCKLTRQTDQSGKSYSLSYQADKTNGYIPLDLSTVKEYSF